jgi:hypothetical protein
MKMQATLSFNYPDDEDKLRRAVNSEQMFEAMLWIKERVREYHLHDDNPDSVINAIVDKVNHTFKLIGEP